MLQTVVFITDMTVVIPLGEPHPSHGYIPSPCSKYCPKALSLNLNSSVKLLIMLFLLA